MTVHNYELELIKPANIRGSVHGKIDAYTWLYNEVINTPTNQLTAQTLKGRIKEKLEYLGCTDLTIKDAGLGRLLSEAVKRHKSNEETT